MSKETQKKYAEQIGMNVGTAQNRLVKDMLFKSLCALGQNSCHQCGEEMTRDTFSIEHKVPWRNAEDAKELFFNTDNISYSHLSCNAKAARCSTRVYGSPDERKLAEQARRRARRQEYLANRTPEQIAADKKKRRESYLRNGC